MGGGGGAVRPPVVFPLYSKNLQAIHTFFWFDLIYLKLSITYRQELISSWAKLWKQGCGSRPDLKKLGYRPDLKKLGYRSDLKKLGYRSDLKKLGFVQKKLWIRPEKELEFNLTFNYYLRYSMMKSEKCIESADGSYWAPCVDTYNCSILEGIAGCLDRIQYFCKTWSGSDNNILIFYLILNVLACLQSGILHLSVWLF